MNTFYYGSLAFDSFMIQMLFLASLILHHLPILCSCPTPATKKLPSLENWSEFTNPVCKVERKKQ